MLIAVVAGAVILVVVLALGVRQVRSSRSTADTRKPGGATRSPAAASAAARVPALRTAQPASRPAPRESTERRQVAPPAPRAPSPSAAPTASAPVAANGNRVRRPTVLVVDDSPVMRRTLMTLFAKAGYQTVGAEGGAAAVTWIRGNGMPGLVTLDMEMPGMDGLQTLDALRALGAAGDVRAVFVTSKMHNERARETAAQRGAIGFFSKPYNPDDLLALAQRVAPLA